jgi:hypothetical protein
VIPFQGLIVNVLTLITLFVLWQRPIHALWWIVLGLFILNRIFVSKLGNSLKRNGMQNKATKVWGYITELTQYALIGISIYVLFIK